MLTLDQRERMRRAYYIDHKSIRQIAAEEGHSREAVSKVIAEDPPPLYQRTRQKPAHVFGPFQSRVDELMERNERLPKKQRYTSHKIFELLQSGASTSKPEKCTLSKGACPSNVFIRLLRWIERKAFQLETHALS